MGYEDLSGSEALVRDLNNACSKLRKQSKVLRHRIAKLERPTHGVVCYPKDDEHNRRHTFWIRWAGSGPPPKDWGRVKKIFRVPGGGE